jgi:PAS domain S-box-containing protein
MKDADKTKEELMQELAALRKRIAELEAVETRRRQSEAALREAEARYRTLVEQIPAALYIDAIDGTSSAVYMSSQIEAMLGYTVEEWLADPELWPKLLHPDDCQCVLAEHARTNVTYEPFVMEYRMVSRDGHIVWVYDEAQVVRDDAGRPRFWQGILSNITERKRAESQGEAALTALRETERRYREVFDNTTDCIFLLDVTADGRFKAADFKPTGEKMVGLSAADVTGKYTEEFLSPKLAEAMNANYRRCVEAGAPISYEETLQLPVGEVSFSTTLIPVKDVAGRIYRIVGIAHDITELKCAGAALQESEQRFRTIFDAVEEAIFVHDLDTGAIVDVNRKTCEIYGYAREDFRQLTIGDLSSGEAPYTQAGALERLKKAAGGEAQLFEWRARDRSGRLFWIEINIKRTAIGGQERLLATGHDITERKQAREALALKVEQLAALSQTAQMVNTFLELDQVLAEIVSLAAKVALSDHAGVVLVDETGQLVQSAETLPGMPALQYRIRDEGFTRWIIRSRQAVIIDKIGPDGAVTPDLGEGAPRLANPHLVEAGVKALAGLPLLARGHLAGVLYLHSRRAGAFRDQLSLLTVFANQAAIAIENAHLYEAAQQELAERRRAEEALRQSEERLRLITDNMLDMVSQVNLEGNHVYVSPAHKRVLGYEPEELLGRSILDLLHPEDVERVGGVIQAALQNREPARVEFRYRHADGHYLWLETMGKLLVDDDGSPIGAVLSGRDITERKRAEEEVRRLNQFLDSVIDNAKIWLDVLNEKADVVVWNKAAEEISGYSREEVVGHGQIWHWLYPDEGYRNIVLGDAIAVIDKGGEEQDAETTIRRKDGQTRTISWNSRRLVDEKGAPMGSIALGRDITEHKQAESQRDATLEALRKSEERFRGTLDTMLEGCQIIGFDWKYLYVNDGAAQHGRRAKDELLGQTMMEAYPGIEETAMFEALRCCMDKRAPRRMKNKFHYADGSSAWFDLSFQPVPEGVFVLSYDITERERSEEVLEQRAAQLAILNDVGGKIAAVLDLDSVLQRAVQLVQERFGYHHAGLFVLDGAQGELVMRAKAGDFTHLFPPDHRLKLGQGMVGWAGQHGQTLLSNDVDTEPRFVNLYPGVVPTASELSVPLRIGEETIGVLDVQSPQRDAFSENDVLVMETLADQVAVAIENARLYEAAQRELAERMQAESQRDATLEALRASETRYRTLFENAPIGIYRAAPDGRILAANPALIQMLGYSSSSELATRNLEQEGYHPDYPRSRFKERIEREGEVRGMDSLWTKRDGSTICVRENARAVRGADGAVLYYEGTVEDITEHKQAEEKIRQRNRELALLNQVIAVSVSNSEPGVILEAVCRELANAFDVPHAVAALLNEEKTEAVVVAEYSAAESAQTTLGQVFPVKGNPSFQYVLSHRVPLIVGGTQHDLRLAQIHELMRERGTVSLLLLPLLIEDEVVGGLGLDTVEPRHFSPEEVSLAWSVADQVAGALARAQLAQTQQRLIAAIEQAAESVIITDTQGVLLYVNPGFEQASGYSRAEVIGQDANILASGKHDAAFYRDLWATISAGRVWHGRFINRKIDGSLYTEDATITPVRGENGAIVSYVSVQRDVTRELQLEEQYRQAQKMELVGRLTAGIAHDFNNLLTAINGFAELARSKSAPGDPLAESLDKILSSGWRAADLVRQLMAFSRKQVVEPQVLSLNEVVANMDKMLRRVIGEDIALKMILAPDVWRVKVDPAQIEQVIVNLAVNARDAMPDGGHLTIETANMVLDEDYAARHLDVQPGRYVVLAVSDDGVGISDEVKAHLFEPFFTTKGSGKGTGLGLATVFGIVKGSDGHIWCYSEVGQGTTFKIYLPAIQSAAASAVRREELGGLRGGSETILLVEDDPSVRELTARVLRQQGYTVLAASNGDEALRLAREHRQPIHLLLTDVVMPGLSGRALIKQLAQIYPGLKTLFMSGYTDDAIVHQGVLEPGVAFLQKPFSPLALARKVRGVLDTN